MLTDAIARISAAQTWKPSRSRARSPSPALIDRRFKLSACRASLPSTAFTSTITSRAYSSSPASCACSISTSAQRHQRVPHRQSRRGQDLPGQDHAWRVCQAINECCSPPPWTCSTILASQVDHSLIRKLKLYTEPSLLVVDELGYLSLDQHTSNLFYQVSPPATAISAAHSLRPIPLSPTGATSSTTQPSPPPSPIGWWKTPRSSCSAARAFAKG